MYRLISIQFFITKFEKYDLQECMEGYTCRPSYKQCSAAI